jgi:hypothetical protein
VIESSTVLRILAIVALVWFLQWFIVELVAIRSKEPRILRDPYSWRDVVFSWPGIILIFVTYFTVTIFVLPRAVEWLVSLPSGGIGQ